MSTPSVNSYVLLTSSDWDEWSSILKAFLMTKSWLNYILMEPPAPAIVGAASAFPDYKASEAQATAGTIILSWEGIPLPPPRHIQQRPLT